MVKCSGYIDFTSHFLALYLAVTLVRYLLILFYSEQGLRDEGKPLFGELASRKVECLSAIVRFSAVCSQVLHPEIVKKHCVSLLSGWPSLY